MGECADKLRNFYNLSSEEKLYIISIDYLTKYSNKPTMNMLLKYILKMEHN